nr:hypothetical protein [Tanacetum cinerariifolium]
RDDAPIKERSMDEGEAATERISDDSEEMETVLTSMNAATVLVSRVVDVPTGSGSIPTASTPAKEQVPTDSDVVPTAKKSEHNVDFHPMVDFIEASPLRIETIEEGTQILAIVDGIHRTVTESSLRRNLKLKYKEGISSLPDTELFENLTLMGYNISLNQKFTFQKGQFSHQWKYLIHTIMQCLSPKSTGFNEFNSNIVTPIVCLATNRTYNFSKMIFDGLVKNVNNKVSKFLIYPIFLTMCLRMSQFGQIAHTHTYVVPFHTRKLFTTLRVNSPSFSGRIVPLFDTMLVQQGEGSGTPTEPHHTPSPEAQPPSHTTLSSSTLPPITTTFIPTVTPSETTPIRQYTRRARIAQSYSLPTITDEPESSLRDVSQGEACPTDSGFVADQDRATIAKSSTLPHDLAPRVTSPVADEGRRSLDEGEAADERTRDDTEEMATVLTSMDAATVLASEIVEVPTGSGSITTAGSPVAKVPTGSDVVPTASPVFATATVVTSYRRRKGKEVMVESDTPKKQKVQEQIDAHVARELEEQLEKEDQRRSAQIARDAEIAGIHVEEELQIMIDGLERNNETIAKYLQEYHQFASELPIERRIELISDLVKYQDNYTKIYKFQSQQIKPWTKKQKRDYYMAVIRNNLGWKVKDFRGMTFEEVEAKFNSVWKQMEDFIPMGSKEEAERIKRKGLSLEQESGKKHKTSEEVTEEAKSPDEVLKEKVHTEGQRSYWKITSGEGLPSKEGSSTYDDQLQALSGKLLTYGIEFPLAEEVPTASEEDCHCQKRRDATARKIALLSKSRRNCQSKSNDSFTKLVPHVASCILGITITVTSCTRTPCPIKGVL